MMVTQTSIKIAICKSLTLLNYFIGFICIEGQKANCDSFWQHIKSLNWQKISLIEEENNLPSRSFNQFEEIPDNSQMFKVLGEKHCEKTIKTYLGLGSK